MTLREQREAVREILDAIVPRNDDQQYVSRVEAMARLCRLGRIVSQGLFGMAAAADCFCDDRLSLGDYRYEARVLEFIEQAVAEKLGGKA